MIESTSRPVLTLDGQATVLQANDVIVWYSTGCVSLVRKGKILRNAWSDDKTYLGIDKSSFGALARLMAASHGLCLEHVETAGPHAGDRLAYTFVSPGN